MKKGETATWEQAVLWLRAQPNQSELVRACFFDDPALAAADRYYQSTEWRAMQDLLPGHAGRALDIGAGRGISSYALARDGWSVVALEPDPSTIVGAGAIRQLNEECKLAIEVVETWGEHLPFGDSSFDLVYCRQVLHHAADLRRLCLEMARVLVPGGSLIATREHVISRKEDLQAFQSAHPLHFLYGGEMAYLLSDYVQAITGSGLELLQAFNPLESDLNLFPETTVTLRRRISERLRIPSSWIPDWALSWKGAHMNEPGRLYSFVAKKRHE